MRRKNTAVDEQDKLEKLVTTKSLEFIKDRLYIDNNYFGSGEAIHLNFYFCEIEKIYRIFGYDGLLAYYENKADKRFMFDQTNVELNLSRSVVEFKQKLVLRPKIIGAYINNPSQYKLNTTFPGAKIILLNRQQAPQNHSMSVLSDFLVLKHIAQIIGTSKAEDMFITQRELKHLETKHTEKYYKKIYTINKGF